MDQWLLRHHQVDTSVVFFFLDLWVRQDVFGKRRVFRWGRRPYVDVKQWRRWLDITDSDTCEDKLW